MTSQKTCIPGVLLLNPPRFDDERGSFRPIFAERLHPELEIPSTWSEMNFSHTLTDCIRGLHFQSPNPQAKLITVISGYIWDVVVDLRENSPTKGRFESYHLSSHGDYPSQIYLPEGIAHGFATTAEEAYISYLVSSPWSPGSEHVLAWNDPSLAIPWPTKKPQISGRDSKGLSLKQAIEIFNQAD